MNLNDFPFLTCALEYVHYRTSHTIENLEFDALEIVLKNVIRCYSIRGFNIVVKLVDTQFKAVY